MHRSPADILRSARIARGFATAAEAARYFGWSDVTYTSHENGTRGLRKDTAERYAKAYGIDAATLLGLTSSSLHIDADQGVNIIGTAAWGLWRDTAMQYMGTSVHIDLPRSTKGTPRRAVLIGDASVDKTVLQDSYAIYEPVLEPATIPTGRLVVIRRTRGTLEELSVRRVQSNIDGRLRLTSHSHSPHYHEVITLDLTDPEGVEILGIVVGKYAPL
jgi:hypothetical protein